MARTLTAPPTDRGYWRSLLKLAHPDAYGSHDLFIWVQALYEHVAGDVVEVPVPPQPPPHPPRQTERVDFSEAFNRFGSHGALTDHILAASRSYPGPFSAVLRLLADLQDAPASDVRQTRSDSELR